MSTDLDQDDIEQDIPLVKEQLKAPLPKLGAKVGIIAPGSRPEKPSVLERSCRTLEEMGYLPQRGKSLLRYDGFSAGRDEERLEDFQSFLEDDSIEAILCASGGYGAIHLLPLLDFGKIRKHPKLICGSGDNDALLLAINELTGLVVFHGPNLDEIKDKQSYDSLRATLAGRLHERPVNCRDAGDEIFEDERYSLSDESCEGITCGGNLTALTSLYGTRYQPDLQGKILFLDDFNERNSILDRWFTTLYLTGTLKEVAGIAFGAFPGCSPRGSDNMLSVEDTFGDRLKKEKTAACFGFKFGLASKDNVVPIGIQSRLDCRAGTLAFLETSLA